jgi:hypothetical protein
VRAVTRAWLLLLSGLAAVAAAALAGPAAAPAAGEYWNKCGERIVGEALIVNTKSHGVTCKRARKVAKRYALGDRHPFDFQCTRPDPDPSGEVSKGVCRRDGDRVKVVFGI